MRRIATQRTVLTLLVLSALAVSVSAQPFGAHASAVKIRTLAVLGKGIAANPSDPLDFMIVKFGLGIARAGNETMALGVLVLDDSKYRLRDVTIEDGHATGNIYSNGTQAGSFDVSSVMKGDTEVWAGTMTLDGKTYNVYVIEGVRPVRASELKEKVADYCREHPQEPECRNKVQEYCKNNPEDARCKALFRAYCLKGDNMKDLRCREAFREFCEEHPANARCVPFELRRAKSYCEKYSDSNLCRKIGTRIAEFCKEHPDNEGCAAVKQLVAARPKLLQNIQEIRERIRNLRITAIKSGMTDDSGDEDEGEGPLAGTKMPGQLNIPLPGSNEGGE